MTGFFGFENRISRRHRTWAAVILGFVVASALGGILVRGPVDRAGRLVVSQPRVVVLKAKRVLHLFDGNRLVRSYPIDLGTNPKGPKRHKDDQRTPEGRFRVVTKNARSPYSRFLGIDYPNEAAVVHGLSEGLISIGQATAIRRSLANGQRPDWTTALGGGLGIHGQGRGRDWTAGCIALPDDMVAELFDVLRIGDAVEILP